MAEHTEVKVVDDLDPTLPGEFRVILGVNDRVVRLDLSRSNYERLIGFLSPFLDKGKTLEDMDLIREDLKRRIDPFHIRTWAKTQGLDIQKRGRIPQDIEERYIQTEVAQYNP